MADAPPTAAPAGGARPARVPRGQPLWAQLRQSLIDRIAAGGLPPHARLPSEAELCAEFGVSRTVVREALNQLVVERRVYKMQGKGSFVADAREDQDFAGSKISFSGDFIGKNHVVSRRVLSQRLRPPSEREARMLRLEPDETAVVEIDRLLTVDNTPRMMVYTVLRPSVVPGMEGLPMQNKPLYDTLRRQYGVVLDRAERWIEAAAATKEVAELLEVAPGAPVLRIESLSSIAGGLMVEYYTAYHRSDQARLHFIIR
ncbi:GntR family transcriptional regulator [Amaricoccus solimangrovi]|uniref:GntR family transcriptional regulator n=1 Tax=Amaricoccus solimangrovi TaxID=2589815 RepID=UPI0015E4503B|nr:GntR family transcriptional regulator [Amaricoccus solimangrovi]